MSAGTTRVAREIGGADAVVVRRAGSEPGEYRRMSQKRRSIERRILSVAWSRAVLKTRGRKLIGRPGNRRLAETEREIGDSGNNRRGRVRGSDRRCRCCGDRLGSGSNGLGCRRCDCRFCRRRSAIQLGKCRSCRDQEQDEQEHVHDKRFSVMLHTKRLICIKFPPFNVLQGWQSTPRNKHPWVDSL